MGSYNRQEARRMGANVTMLCCYMTYGTFGTPDFNIIKVTTSEEMYNTVMSELSSKKYDIVILAAAVRHFT